MTAPVFGELNEWPHRRGYSVASAGVRSPRSGACAGRAARRSAGVMLGVGVEQAPDHALILRVVTARLTLEELNASLAQRDRHLDSLIAKDKILRRWKEVRYDP
jgi:hypothetical protein